jgi:predicted DNA-binding transcriptional regulator AlpA
MPQAQTLTPQGRESRVDINFVCDRFAVRALSIYRWYKVGTFPKPHYIVNKRVWYYGDILDWESANTKFDPPLKPGANRKITDLHPAKVVVAKIETP